MEMQGITNMEVAQGQSNLEHTLISLSEAVDRLQENLDRHHHRVGPVLNDFPLPTEGSNSVDPDRPPYSTVVKTINDQIERLNFLSNRLNDLTYRLDV